ncbi:MAG: chromosomal replication initiator protein DnaA [Candidatus Nealsonbacteria bacterium]|nr:chromosomal replication initiator protein DnaA [Candidatus Nealsonbacteria bacterium]
MDKSASQIWEAALGVLQLEVNKPNFETWLKFTKGVRFQNNLFVIETPNDFIAEWLKERMSSLIIRTLSGIVGKNVEVDFQVQKTTINIVSKRPSGLNPKYTFDTFIVGEVNRLAYNVAKEVAEKPEIDFNPLFIFGAPGNGKTHLLHAIGHVIGANGSQVLILSAEGFTNQFVWSIKKKEPDKFRDMFSSADLLMIDDVQFIQGKPKTQESLTDIFNELHVSDRKIVLAGDCPPYEMRLLDNRLRSRFEGGLVVDIKPLDHHMRQAILKAKAKGIPNEVIELISSLDIDNVRKLEGYLNKVLTYCRLVTGTIDLDSAKTALKNMVDNQDIAPSACKIIETVASHFNLSTTALNGGRKNKNVVEPRQIAMFLLREETDRSFEQIGKDLGGKDHSTVVHACKKVENSSSLLEEAEKIKQKIASH